MNFTLVSKRLELYILVIFSIILMSSNSYAFSYKGIDINLQGTISEMYDSNSGFSGNSKEDFVTQLSLGIGIVYESKRRIVDFTGKVSQNTFSEQRNTSASLNLSFQNEFTPDDRIRINNTFSYTVRPVSFEEEFVRNKVVSQSAYYNNIFHFSYARDVSEKFSVVTHYSNELSHSPESATNSYINSIGLSTIYTYDSATDFLLSYTVAKSEFTGWDLSRHTVSAGVRRYITKQLYFDGTGGADFIESSLGNNNDTGVGEYFKILLTDEFKNTNVSIAFEKRIEATVFSEDLFSSWRISPTLEGKVSNRLNFLLSGFYGKGIFESSDISFTLWGANPGLSYEFNEHLIGKVGYSFSKKESTDVNIINAYIRNTMFLGLTVEF